jgi:hypothetical protein
VSKVESVVVAVKINSVEATVSVITRDLAGVVFEHVDNFAVLSVPLEVWVGLVGYVNTDTVARLEDRHTQTVTSTRRKYYSLPFDSPTGL